MKLLYLLPILLISTILPVYAGIDSTLLTGDTVTFGFYTSLDLFFENGKFDDGSFTIVDMSTWDLQSFPIEVITINDNNIIITSNLDGERFLNGKIVLSGDEILAHITIFSPNYGNYELEYVLDSFN